MENPLSSIYMPSSSSKALVSSPSSARGGNGGTPAVQTTKGRKRKLMKKLVLNICKPERRNKAILDLSKKREMFQDLAPILWNSFGTISVLLLEIVSIYPALSPPNLTLAASKRVCNILTLLQCVASHPETKTHFLEAQIPIYIYPFLSTKDKTRPFEYLRLTSLSVIGTLVKVEDTEVINYLLKSEFIPLCLQTMEIGTELSNTVATLIVQKVLQDDIGLCYICATPERFFVTSSALASMVISLVYEPSTRLLKHIIRCYLRLSDDPRACTALKICLPVMLKDGTFDNNLKDPSIQHCLQLLLAKVSAESKEAGAPQPGPADSPAK